MAFIIVGTALGPYGANIIAGGALDVLDPITTTALAVLGAFIGLRIGRRTVPPRLIAAACVELVVTLVILAAGLWLEVRSWRLPLDFEPLSFAALMAACGSASAAARTRGSDRLMRRAAAVADVDDVPLTVLGAITIAHLAGSDAALRLAGAAIAAGVLAVASALLLNDSSSVRERGVFVAGGILLTGGSAAYLGTSPLLSGCVLGIVWARSPHRVRQAAGMELRRFQHPLMALLLVFAGAAASWSTVVLWLIPAVLLLRMAGKLLGGAAAAPLAEMPPSLLATMLLPPGILGLAIALNAQQLLGTRGAPIVATTTAVVVAAEIMALFLMREELVA